METTNHIVYDIDQSSQRMDQILSVSNVNFSDSSTIPLRQSLSYTNGFYVNVTALFIDIVDSSNMTEAHKRPVIAKIYRCFISECTALMNALSICKEISIHGDCVWGVFETSLKSDVDKVFSVAARLNSLIKVLNYKLQKKGYSEISIGIGIDYGRALMIKAGFSGSGLNDVIWMGDVVNEACHIANEAGRNGRPKIIVSNCIFQNLNNKNQNLLSRTYIGTKVYYGGSIINTALENWFRQNCK